MSDLNDKEYFVRILNFMSSNIDRFDDDGMAYALANLAMKASENVCVARVAETHSNPLEAIGIVMRETGTHIDSTTEIRFYNKRGQQCLRIDTCDIYGTTSGEGILNTLKEGK